MGRIGGHYADAIKSVILPLQAGRAAARMTKFRLPPTGFLSYARQDDELSGQKLSKLRERIKAELQLQYGRQTVKLFQDVHTIPHGATWEREILNALRESTFFIPIITPNFIQSEWCCREVMIFLKREREIFALHPELAQRSLIFPIDYRPIRDGAADASEALVMLRERKWCSFQNLRDKDPQGEAVSGALYPFAESICDLLLTELEAPPSPEELARRQAETEARREREQQAEREAAEEARKRDEELVRAEEARKREEEVSRQAEAEDRLRRDEESGRQAAAAEAAQALRRRSWEQEERRRDATRQERGRMRAEARAAVMAGAEEQGSWQATGSEDKQAVDSEWIDWLKRQPALLLSIASAVALVVIGALALSRWSGSSPVTQIIDNRTGPATAEVEENLSATFPTLSANAGSGKSRTGRGYAPTIIVGGFTGIAAAWQARDRLVRRFPYLESLTFQVKMPERGQKFYRLYAVGANADKLCDRLRRDGKVCLHVTALPPAP